jgi:hypothetical protein
VAHGKVPDDDIARSLHQLADEYERRLGSTASVERDDSYGQAVRLHPARPGARSVGWVDFGDELAAFVGEHGWWELERQPDDLDFIKLACDAVIAGKGYEVTAPARSLVALELADGQPARDVSSEGCLLQFVPLPGWKRWGRRVTYLPYR